MDNGSTFSYRWDGVSGGIIPSFLTHREDCKRKEVYPAEEIEQFKLISFFEYDHNVR